MSSQLRENFEHFKDFEFKERMFTSLVDIITQAIFLTITPQVREAFTALNRGDRKDITAYKSFLLSVSAITRDTIWWLHDVVPKLFKPEPNTYTGMLYKSLFMTQTHEEYFRLDGFPIETDSTLLQVDSRDTCAAGDASADILDRNGQDPATEWSGLSDNIGEPDQESGRSPCPRHQRLSHPELRQGG